MKNNILTHSLFNLALEELKGQDKDLEAALLKFGPPPMWKREPGFPSLVQIILEQQVSLASARAAFRRLQQTVPELTPHEFLKLDDKTLKKIGFSRQKARYVRILSEALKEGALDLEGLKKLDDGQARKELLKLTGIGPWTADIYLMMALRRPDIFPSGDLALATAVQEVKKLKTRPSPQKLEDFSQKWKPWRAVAARICWHYYLSKRA